jgi:hypothetical protein
VPQRSSSGPGLHQPRPASSRNVFTLPAGGAVRGWPDAQNPDPGSIKGWVLQRNERQRRDGKSLSKPTTVSGRPPNGSTGHAGKRWARPKKSVDGRLCRRFCIGGEKRAIIGIAAGPRASARRLERPTPTHDAARHAAGSQHPADHQEPLSPLWTSRRRRLVGSQKIDANQRAVWQNQKFCWALNFHIDTAPQHL